MRAESEVISARAGLAKATVLWGMQPAQDERLAVSYPRGAPGERRLRIDRNGSW